MSDKNQKVIKFENEIKDNQINNGSQTNKNILGNRPQEIQQNIELSNKVKKHKNWIIITVIVFLIVAGIVALALYLINIPRTPTCKDDSTLCFVQKNSTKPNFEPLEMQKEYKIKTNENDLKRIYINQKYHEYIKIEGVLSENLVDRKTNYDIYISNKIEAPKELKNFYNYTFVCAIAISSECISTQDEYCLPKKLVDLNNQDYSHIRNLQQINSFENFPLPLCFFNMTDNNVITSISCHKNLSESKVNSIVLDLYFFRPPGIKRINIENTNVTINSFKEGNNEVIRERNGGICDIDNPLGSFCSTDMNTTKDSQGNLIKYDEVAFTNITKNRNNYYVKNKTTNLLDKTEHLDVLNPDKFNETLNRLYPHLQNYLKTYIQFSDENFKELYNESKGISKENNNRRKLEKTSKPIVVGQNLFTFEHYGGVQIILTLKDNVGLNTQAMEASSNIGIDDEEKDIAILKEYSDIDKAIKNLINLSKAGNNLANILYENIKENLNNITKIISINIENMDNLVVYKELSEIFDSTYSLKDLKIIPNRIIEESNNLINKLDNIYNGIDNGSLKNNIRVLSNYIYKFIKQSHILINNISNNLTKLGNLIKSPKQTISDISNYYMNHTSTSYVNTIEEGKKIFNNYYINELNLIIPEVDKILGVFENITVNSIKKQTNLINNLYIQLSKNDLIIDNAGIEDYTKIKTNLQNSYNYITNIINLFKNKIKNELDLKDGYFITKDEISLNNKTFNNIIDEELMIAKNLDNNEYVDKIFDEIMTNFRKNFTNITKYMGEKKEEIFLPEENVLKSEYFKVSEQNNLADELKHLGVEVIKEIKKENNLYLNTIKNEVNEFLKINKDYLNKLISEINILFSEESLQNIEKSYDEAFNRYLNKISNDLEENENLTCNYFDGMVNLITNNTNVVELLANYPVDKEIPKIKKPCLDDIDQDCYEYTTYEDTISTKKNSEGYLSKYKNFKEKFDISQKFINEELHTNILNEYQNIIIKLKEILQTFKSNKMIFKYPELNDLYFIDNHLKNIDNLYNRLNKYIYNAKFNEYYLPKIKEYKNKQTNNINRIKEYIENQHEIIDNSSTSNEFSKDFCTTFKRKRVYTCRNGAVYNVSESEDICLESWGFNNIDNFVKLSFKSDEIFQKSFNLFYYTIKNKTDIYSNLINILKTKIASIESTILEKNKNNNYLYPIQNKTYFILSEKLSDNLIKASYNHYKNDLNNKLEYILNDISNKWEESFDILNENVQNNKNNFTHSINEFGVMALIYESVISQNLTNRFYDSIIEHQKNEFNYTISYYYNCIIQNIISVYQFIYNQIPTNDEGFNNIINLRKNEVKDSFDKLLIKIKESKEKALTIDKQIYVLKVSKINFFNTNSILVQKNEEIKNTLNSKGKAIYKIKNGKQNDEISLACRFYLENSQNGLQIEEYYQQIDDNLFFYLNLENFKKIFSEKWIFDQDDIINQLNISIYNSTLEIKNDYLIKKEEYSKTLEKVIHSQYYTKESIAQKISEQFKLGIKGIDNDMKNDIILNITKILEFIKTKILNEEERLKTHVVSYTNNLKIINNTIQNYKETILNRLNEIINKIVDNFYNSMLQQAYTEIIENGLNEYLFIAENYSSTCQNYTTLNSTYNIGYEIYKIVNDLVVEYKNLTKMQIEYKRDEYINKLKKEAGIEEIKHIIDKELDPEYFKLLNCLNKNPGSFDTDYDFEDVVKKDIIFKVDEIMENINDTLYTIKGDVKLIGWDILDFSRLKDNIFDNNIKKDFNTFMLHYIDFEKNKTNQLIKGIIRQNFNILIENLIFSFGNEFFERMIKYNENFKIINLYQNLKYSLVISLNYYQLLYGFKRDIESLTKDLKIKLYNLNNLDLISEAKNKKVLELLIKNADDFIKKSRIHIINEYKKKIKEDISIQSIFNNNTLKRIESNLEDISLDLENDYTSLLNENFKNKIIKSYTDIMNAQTNDMIETVNGLKLNIKSLFDDLFQLDIDKVLNETNYQMNLTLESIQEYYTHFNSFKIPEELIEFINEYANNIIKPSYEGLESLLNKETKNLTLKNFEENSKIYEKEYETDEFIKKTDDLCSLLKTDIIELIKKEINKYGIIEYPEKLQNEINRIEKRVLRRLDDEQTKEDEIEEYKEKIDYSLDDIFNQLLNISENINKYILTYENFDIIEEIIKNNIKKLNSSYKQSQQIIDSTFLEEDDIYPILNDKLQNLYNFSLDYYNTIQSNFLYLRKYITESFNEIDDLLIQCANITYKTFSDKYEEISRLTEEVDTLQNSIDKELPSIQKTSNSQNTEFITEAKIENLEKKAKFKFSIIYEEERGIKRPKILAIINNQIRPEKMHFKISSPFGTCGNNYQKVDVEFNNVNYTIVLKFDTNSNLINITSFTDFDSYYYKVGRYKVEDSLNNVCADNLSINICIEDECDEDTPIVISELKKIYPSLKRQQDSLIIQG